MRHRTFKTADDIEVPHVPQSLVQMEYVCRRFGLRFLKLADDLREAFPEQFGAPKSYERPATEFDDREQRGEEEK